MWRILPNLLHLRDKIGFRRLSDVIQILNQALISVVESTGVLYVKRRFTRSRSSHFKADLGIRRASIAEVSANWDVEGTSVTSIIPNSWGCRIAKHVSPEISWKEGPVGRH
jgi:hypothetical protein